MLSVQCDLNKTKKNVQKRLHHSSCFSSSCFVFFIAIRNIQESADSCRKMNEVLYFRQLQENNSGFRFLKNI